MRTPAFRRMRKRLRNLGARMLSPLVYVVDGVATTLDSTATDEGDAEWGLSWARSDESRWRRGSEVVDCFRFDDGYVATAGFDDRETQWQLTPGPVPLGSALAATSLFMQHSLTPQIDSAGRPFIACDDDGPRQVFEEPDGDESVRYVYLDGIRTLEEFPSFLDVRVDVKRAFTRMAPKRANSHET